MSYVFNALLVKITVSKELWTHRILSSNQDAIEVSLDGVKATLTLHTNKEDPTEGELHLDLQKESE